MSIDECSKFEGRLYDLCTGCGHDGRPDPSRSLANRYRELWGLPKLEDDEWDSAQPSRGLGDTLAKLTSKVGIKPCSGCKKRQKALNRLVPFSRRRTSNPFAFADGVSPPFITTKMLMEDVKTLASQLPAETNAIIGIARSGLCVATMVSIVLHRPLFIARQSLRDIVPSGNGWRLTGQVGGKSGVAVLIDDTVMTGNSLKAILPMVRKTHPEIVSAAVYVNPAAKHKPDIWVRDLPWPHLLEWNLFNSVLSPHVATDFDGILCGDCPPGSDDDGEKYLDFLANAKPLYPVRKVPIPLIVTARLEKYRPQTLAWLQRHGVEAKQIVMGPWSNNQERAQADIATFKAEHFRRFLQKRHAIQPPLFVESDLRQAERIAALSGGIVVCPTAERCFP